ncbi:MAG TPA: restriction endonuclease subunit S [bacterium]|nr:restriction endonuclease subunit S [bacterium]
MPFEKLAKQIKRDVVVEPNVEYPILAMSWYAKGLYIKHRKLGSEIKASKLYRVKAGDFVYNRLFAWKGSFGEVPDELDSCFLSNEFPVFVINNELIEPGYLWAYFSQPDLWDYIERLSTGTTSTSRLRLKEAKIKKFQIPVPPNEVQRKIANVWITYLQTEREIDSLNTSLKEISPSIYERSIKAIW